MIEKKTKVVATIGPKSGTYEMLWAMIQEGMNIMRLNFSHGKYEEHQTYIDNVRQIEKDHHVNCGILLDTKGPEIRLGKFANDVEQYEIGEEVTICKEEILGTHERFHIQVPEVFADVEPGDYILVNDGKQRLTILDVNPDEIRARVEVKGPLASNKGCNIPGVKLSMPFVSPKDDADIRWACKNDVDFIAASFVRRPEDVLAIRKILAEEGKPKIEIIAKIENQEGFDNLEAILEVADGIMVARGDLGVEVDTSSVPIYQKKMIKAANKVGKAVITATHMLDSMTNNPRCTRAEASDVCNAVLDGTDAVMLSGETAGGDYPIESVRTMATICKAAEEIIPYRERLDINRNTLDPTVEDAIGIAISEATLTLDIAAVVVFTQGGTTARRVSKYRPPVPVYAVTFTKSTMGKIELYWGIHPIYSTVENNLQNDDELACAVAKANGIKPGQKIIISAGYPVGIGSANMMKIIEVK